MSKHTPGPWMEESQMNQVSPAFMHYLASLPRQEAGQHLLECLRSSPGDTENEAWKIDATSFSKVLDYIYKGNPNALR